MRHTQKNNPDQARFNFIDDALEHNHRRIEDMQREIRAIERLSQSLQDEAQTLRETRFVICSKDESFFEHLADVEYVDGYYETIEKALNARDHYPNGWKILNLDGVNVLDSDEFVLGGS